MSVIKCTLPEEARRTTGETLQGALVDLVDLSLIGKQAHWNLVGPHFYPIHLQLDELVATARGYADTVAERAAAIGVSPDGRAETVARTSGAPRMGDGWAKDTDAVRLVVEALDAVIRRMRERIDATEKTDLVTQDVFLGLTRELEKHSWMFQAESHS